jgi:hypothetical protein
VLGNRVERGTTVTSSKMHGYSAEDEIPTTRSATLENNREYPAGRHSLQKSIQREAKQPPVSSDSQVNHFSLLQTQDRGTRNVSWHMDLVKWDPESRKEAHALHRGPSTHIHNVCAVLDSSDELRGHKLRRERQIIWFVWSNRLKRLLSETLVAQYLLIILMSQGRDLEAICVIRLQRSKHMAECTAGHHFLYSRAMCAILLHRTGAAQTNTRMK